MSGVQPPSIPAMDQELAQRRPWEVRPRSLLHRASPSVEEPNRTKRKGCEQSTFAEVRERVTEGMERRSSRRRHPVGTFCRSRHGRLSDRLRAHIHEQEMASLGRRGRPAVHGLHDVRPAGSPIMPEIRGGTLRRTHQFSFLPTSGSIPFNQAISLWQAFQ